MCSKVRQEEHNHTRLLEQRMSQHVHASISKHTLSHKIIHSCIIHSCIHSQMEREWRRYLYMNGSIDVLDALQQREGCFKMPRRHCIVQGIHSDMVLQTGIGTPFFEDLDQGCKGASCGIMQRSASKLVNLVASGACRKQLQAYVQVVVAQLGLGEGGGMRLAHRSAMEWCEALGVRRIRFCSARQ